MIIVLCHLAHGHSVSGVYFVSCSLRQIHSALRLRHSVHVAIFVELVFQGLRSEIKAQFVLFGLATRTALPP